jgi:hypothetical protein
LYFIHLIPLIVILQSETEQECYQLYSVVSKPPFSSQSRSFRIASCVRSYISHGGSGSSASPLAISLLCQDRDRPPRCLASNNSPISWLLHPPLPYVRGVPQKSLLLWNLWLRDRTSVHTISPLRFAGRHLRPVNVPRGWRARQRNDFIPGFSLSCQIVVV